EALLVERRGDLPEQLFQDGCRTRIAFGRTRWRGWARRRAVPALGRRPGTGRFPVAGAAISGKRDGIRVHIHLEEIAIRPEGGGGATQDSGGLVGCGRLREIDLEAGGVVAPRA